MNGRPSRRDTATPLTLTSFPRLSECTSWNRRHSATQCDSGHGRVASSHDGCQMTGATSIGIVLWPLSGFVIYRGWRIIRMASSRLRKPHGLFMALELLFGMVHCGGGGSCGVGNWSEEEGMGRERGGEGSQRVGGVPNCHLPRGQVFHTAHLN